MLVSFDALAQQFAQYTDVKGKIRREVQGGRRQFPVQHVVCARAGNGGGTLRRTGVCRESGTSAGEDQAAELQRYLF